MLDWRYWTDWARLIVPNGEVCFNDNVSTNPYQASLPLSAGSLVSTIPIVVEREQRPEP